MFIFFRFSARSLQVIFLEFAFFQNEEEKLEKLGFQLTLPKHGMSKHGTGFSLRF